MTELRFHNINKPNCSGEVWVILSIKAWSVTRAEIKNSSGSNCKPPDDISSYNAHMTEGHEGISTPNHKQLSPLHFLVTLTTLAGQTQMGKKVAKSYQSS